MPGVEPPGRFTLSYAPETAGFDTGPSVFTALQEQLGLRLEARKSQIEVLVIDHAGRVPSEN